MNYDIIVIGGGHAGIEASLVASKMKKKVLLITPLIEKIGYISCNPAIGGLAKGHLVKEIDALGGEMGKATDASGIQFRILNLSKGPAVRGSRAQIDMQEYCSFMKNSCLAQENLDITQETALNLVVKNQSVVGVTTNLKNRYCAKKIVITTGTFLQGVVHVGDVVQNGGRFNELSCISLSKSLKEYGLKIKRLKTGTCPRVSAKSINFQNMQVQHGDKKPIPFSLYTDKSNFNIKQLPCYITYTNMKTHEIVEKNLKKSSIFSGQIESVGPRYCPSIEDKIYRFKEKDKHHIFIEPQTKSKLEFYINGLSTSLPSSIQKEMLHSISGLEEAKITRYGYAIEYDYVNPTGLLKTLESKTIKNLYLAGQINGTTGYEEAGAQGLMAGINASLSIDNKDPFILRRDEAYIGVMIDDLTLKGTEEPYRMFTSRAEYRLMLREDNADIRLLEYGYKLGIVDKKRYLITKTKINNIQKIMKYVSDKKISPTKKNLEFLKTLGEGVIKDVVLLRDLIARRSFNKEKLLKLNPIFKTLNQEEIDQILIKSKYFYYIKKQKEQIQKMKNMYQTKIPKDVNYKDIPSLSNEAIEKLEEIRPKTLFDASQISGITPASIDVLQILIKNRA